MNNPGGASGTDKPDLFEDLLKQLGEAHRNTLQELEAKVSKLKKDRCLDAQSLEAFYLRNQQLKEQNKTLQGTISLLEERLRAGECDRCAVLDEKLKRHQDQNLQVVAKLKNERNVLQDENGKLQAQLQKLKTSEWESERTSSPEQEDGVIPDSPLMTSSLPAASKLKKRKRGDRRKRVRYAETPLQQQQRSGSLLHAPAGSAERPAKAEVLVPNTCELDASQMSSEVDDGTEEVIAETCGLDLLGNRPNRTEAPPSRQNGTWKHKVRLCPDSTSEKSPSLLLRVKRFSEEASVSGAKRKKKDSEAQGGIDAGEHVNAPSVRQQSLKEHLESKDESAPDEGSLHKSAVSCKSPAFKKPQRKTEGADVKRPEQELKAALQRPEAAEDKRSTVEPVWSMDPALALSEGDEEMEKRRHEDAADTDCTWVSHSMLQRGRRDSRDRGDRKTGLAEKANDSLDMMFDTTAYGTYKSYNGSHLDHSHPGDEAGEEEEEEEHREPDPAENAAHLGKPGQPTFKYAAVIRKKDERRKLKGTTCKECEDYYSHLPDEEKQKKLAACSRHRFLHVPPATPENFWEVGFPSTQTCIDRGYIKEEKNPQARLRRRQPFNALFSQKQKD